MLEQETNYMGSKRFKLSSLDDFKICFLHIMLMMLFLLTTLPLPLLPRPREALSPVVV